MLFLTIFFSFSKSLIDSDKLINMDRNSVFNFDHPIEIHRDSIFEDSFNNLRSLNPSKLKNRIKILFISDQGLVEAGIDGGGIL